jgi:uncharacterized protein (DUF1330 family)
MNKPAYFILEIDIHDAEGMAPYLEKAGATLAPFTASMLANGGETVPLEGAAPQGNVVVVRFDSMDAARSWYDSPAYREILGHRLSAATNRSYFVEGFEA